jgi:hypothetical protein
MPTPTKKPPAKKAPAKARAGTARTNGQPPKPPAGLLGPSEEFDCRPDGTIRWLMLDGQTYWLRRPLLGEYRELTERIRQMRVESRIDSEKLTAARELLQGAQNVDQVSDAMVAMEALGDAGVERTLAWWRGLFATLEQQGRAFPEDKGIGPDILTTTASRIAAIETAWLTPSLPGGE